MTDRTKRLIWLATTAFSAAGLGLLLVQLALNWVSICGSSAYSLTMLVLAIAVAMAAASVLPAWSSNFAISVLGLAAVAFSACSADAVDATLTISGPWASVSIALAFALPAAFVVLPVLCALCWARAIAVRADRENSNALSGPLNHVAICLGFAGVAVMFAQAALQFPAFVAPVFSFVLGTVLSLQFHSGSNRYVSSGAVSDASIAAIEILVAMSSGLLAHAVFRMFGSLFPLNILPFVAAMVLMAVAMGILAWVRFSKMVFPVFAVLGLLSPVLFYGSLAETNLWINATISSAWLATLLRAAQPAAVIVMLWILFRSTEQSQSSPDQSDERPGTLFSIAAYRKLAFFCCGLALGLMSVAFGSAVRLEWIIGLGLISFAAFSRVSGVAGPKREIILPSAVACSVCLLLAISSLPMAETSHMLFSGRSAVAYRDGLDLAVIEESDSHRLLEKYTTAAGEVTVWRTQGDRIEIRIDGFPSGQLSDNSTTSPVPAADALTTILPLVMHDHPDAVMLMGDDVGVGVKICQNFPVPTVKAFQSAAAFGDLASRYLWKQQREELNQDSRFEVLSMPVPLAIRQRRPEGGFDVVISASPNPIVSQRLPEFQREYYRRVRGLMSADGVYCQRISQYDLGAQPMVHLISTIHEEFSSVVVIQAVPGELVVVASCGDRILLDKALLSRLQKSHVKKQLALSGLDWSQVAALPVVQTHGVYSVFEHIRKSSAKSYRSCQLAFSLPLEASRWADKAAELKIAFAPHQLRIADAAPRSKAYAEYARRFTAVIQEGEIVTAFPDNPWPYRKSLKMEMQRNPRPPVEDYVDGKVVRSPDPADQLRKDYFLQLGTLLTQAKMGFTNPADVRKFQRIISTHEPLLTWFAHHELVRIFEATGSLSPAQELRSRLYTINFASVADPGVYQVASALEQLVKQPELIPEVDRRYDHANGLLQELIRRWDLRRNHDPTSAAQAQMDVDRCVQVARQTLEAMETWAPEVNVSADQFSARRRFVHHSLVIPLRKYSDVVLAHRLKTEPSGLADQEWSPDQDTLSGDGLPLLATPGAAATN